MKKIVSLFIFLFLIFACFSFNFAQVQVDANTLMLLRFENNLNGEQGEVPLQSSNIGFGAGVFGQGAVVPNPHQLNYDSNGNINAFEGTVEFWIKPNWNGNDNVHHTMLAWGGQVGGMVIQKDSANNLRIILNQFGAEKGVSINISDWVANQWHHVAFSYSNAQKKLVCFVDGTQKAQQIFTGDLPPITDTTLFIGNDFGNKFSDAVLDEFIISDVARTPQDISNRYLGNLTVSSLIASPTAMNLYVGWSKPVTLTANTNLGTLNVPAISANWVSSNPAVAIFDVNTGKIVGNSLGTAVLTATVNGVSATVNVNVAVPVLQPTEEIIPPALANPMPNALYEMPVVIINYLPTVDGVNIDSSVSGYTGTVAQLRDSITRTFIQHKYMLEEGSRFRGYANGNAPPSLGYRVIKMINVYEEMPEGLVASQSPLVYTPDYAQILTRFGAQSLVQNSDVKEFWIMGYHHGTIAPVESNMSSGITGDISNSYRQNDLPLYGKTYVVYNPNFTRTSAEATHNHGHQLEAMFNYVNQRQDGNTQLFMNKFVGWATNGTWQRGRAGDTHHPPNANGDYDYSNPNAFPSDIADWQPNGGVTQPVSFSTWRNIPYAFPDGIAPTQDDNWWYIYWFQNMPGRNNVIPYNTNKMTNWWQFKGDWDRSNRAGVGLYEPGNCTYLLSASSQTVSASPSSSVAVTVTAPAGCKWFASSNSTWIKMSSFDTSNNGNTVARFTVLENLFPLGH